MTATQSWPMPVDETARLEALHEFNILDQPRDRDLDALARMAAFLCGTPVAEARRDESMCAHSILSHDVTYTPDASVDPVFSTNPHVTGLLDSIRLYVAAPLIVGSGHTIGTVCAFGPHPGELQRVQIERLRDLAEVAVALLELRREPGQLAHAATCLSHRPRTSSRVPWSMPLPPSWSRESRRVEPSLCAPVSSRPPLPSERHCRMRVPERSTTDSSASPRGAPEKSERCIKVAEAASR